MSESSDSEVVGWADASTNTLPLLLESDDDSLNVTIGRLSTNSDTEEEDSRNPGERHEEASDDESTLGQQATQPPPSNLRTVDAERLSPGPSVGARRPRKKNVAVRKVATRNKATQVDMKLIGSSWPRVKKTRSTAGESDSTSGTDRPRTRRNQPNSASSTPQGSLESLSGDNAGDFTSEENLSASLPSSTPNDIVDSEQNVPIINRKSLSVIPEETTEFEISAAELTRHLNPVQPAPPGHPVIASLVINISRSGSSLSVQPLNQPAAPAFSHSGNITCENESIIEPPCASSSLYSNDYSADCETISSTLGSERRVAFQPMGDAMPQKTSQNCGESVKQKKAAPRKTATKSGTSKSKKSSKKPKRSYSRRCHCCDSDSFSDYSDCSTSESCSCSDCCDYSSDSSRCSTPPKRRGKGTLKSGSASSRKKTAMKR